MGFAGNPRKKKRRRSFHSDFSLPSSFSHRPFSLKDIFPKISAEEEEDATTKPPPPPPTERRQEWGPALSNSSSLERKAATRVGRLERVQERGLGRGTRLTNHVLLNQNFSSCHWQKKRITFCNASPSDFPDPRQIPHRPRVFLLLFLSRLLGTRGEEEEQTSGRVRRFSWESVRPPPPPFP